MAANKDEVAALRKNLAQAKQKTMNFGYCPGKKGDDCLLLDARKPMESLVREARKISTGTKTAGGTLTVTGSTINLATESDLPNIGRTLKNYLQSVSISMKVQLVDEGGNVLEADEEEAEETPAQAEPADTPAPPEPDAEPEPEPEATETPDPKLKAALGKRLKQAIANGAGAGPETMAQIRSEAQKIAQHIQSGALPDAAKSLIALEQLIDTAPQNAPAEDEAKVETDAATPPPMAPAQQSWQKARTAARADLKALVSAVAAATGGDPALKGAARQTANLKSHFSQLDKRLETVLARLDKTPTGPERTKLIRVAQTLVAEHQKTLDSPFFKAVDSNGFAATNIRGAMLQSLQQVSAALSA